MTSEKTRSAMANDLPADEGRALRSDAPGNLENVRTVLIEPRQAGNVGSTARALKGMGLADLWLVNPQCEWQDSSDARKFAMNSWEVLESTRQVDTLDEALHDVNFLVGTTHRRRIRRIAQPIAAREAAAEVARVSQNQRVAILFGREDWGITNDDLSRCNLVVSIPMATRNPSLNLAQAVQIWSYELFLASIEGVEPIPFELAERRTVEAVQLRIVQLLRRTDFRPPNDDWTAIEAPVARVLGRTRLERRDLEIIMKLCHDVESFIERRCPKDAEGG